MNADNKIVLVYQSGIANVFSLNRWLLDPEERHEWCLYQGDFKSAVMFVKGMAAAGCRVRTASCNVAGDAGKAKWTPGVNGTPFADVATLVIENSPDRWE